jgi:hypothetical protein
MTFWLLFALCLNKIKGKKKKMTFWSFLLVIYFGCYLLYA